MAYVSPSFPGFWSQPADFPFLMLVSHALSSLPCLYITYTPSSQLYYTRKQLVLLLQRHRKLTGGYTTHILTVSYFTFSKRHIHLPWIISATRSKRSSWKRVYPRPAMRILRVRKYTQFSCFLVDTYNLLEDSIMSRMSVSWILPI
jgi:hypothetical protein